LPEEDRKPSVSTLKKFFELKEGQKLQDFAEELKSLTMEEKLALCDGIESGSLTY